jgi:uroporphyrinogen-III synthase
VAERPLAGRRIVVTRPPEQAQPLAGRLEALGARVELVPLVTIEPIEDASALAAAVRDLSSYDWLVVSSANGAAAVAAALAGAPLAGPRIAAVGPATAAAVAALGTEVDFVPETYAAAEIGSGLGPLEGAHVLLPQAAGAPPDLAAELRSRGAQVDAIPAYRTVAAEPSPAEIAALRVSDAVVLASGSAARSLAAHDGPGGALVACIGPQTASVAREVGLPVGLVADEATAEGIIQALVSHFGEST